MTQVINEDTGRLQTACQYCGEVIEDLSQVMDFEGDEYCPACADQVKIMTFVKAVTEAAIRINFETPFSVTTTLYTDKLGFDVVLCDENGTSIATSRLSFEHRLSEAIASLESIWMTLAEIALYRKLPEGFKRSQFGYLPEVMSA